MYTGPAATYDPIYNSRPDADKFYMAVMSQDQVEMQRLAPIVGINTTEGSFFRGDTALYTAISSAFVLGTDKAKQSIQCLLSLGADPTIMHAGRNAIQQSEALGFTEITNLLRAALEEEKRQEGGSSLVLKHHSGSGEEPPGPDSAAAMA